MKSLKLELFEYRKQLNENQQDVADIVSKHIDICEQYSEKEVFGSLSKMLETYKYYDNVTTLLESIDNELSTNSILYTLKDLYAKIARKDQAFLYDTALSTIIECINQNSDEDRKIKILQELKMYEWIPEINFFLYELASSPQVKQNYISNGGKIDDVYSLVLQLKEGYLTYVANKWFLMNESAIMPTLLENHISDEIQLKKLRLLEQALQIAKIEENKIIFEISEELVLTFNTEDKKIYLNESQADSGTTLETLFNSPIIPFLGRAYYPILNETFNNIDKFMKIDTVKHVYNIAYPTFECYVFNYKDKISQFRIDKRSGSSYYTYEKAMPLIESVIQELGADLTFFYESMLDEEIKEKKKLENEEKVLLEKLNDIETAILTLKEDADIIKENKTVETLYNSLLTKKHKISEDLKSVKNKKNKLI